MKIWPIENDLIQNKNAKKTLRLIFDKIFWQVSRHQTVIPFNSVLIWSTEVFFMNVKPQNSSIEFPVSSFFSFDE